MKIGMVIMLGASDTRTDRLEYERALEGTRHAEQGEIYQPIRRGWSYGAENFRQQLLDRIRGKPTESHGAVERTASDQHHAAGILEEELQKLGWEPIDLARHRKSHPAKLAIARRLRRETTLTLQQIATSLHIGSRTYLRNCLQAPR